MDGIKPDYCREQRDFSVIPYIVDTLEQSRSKAIENSHTVQESVLVGVDEDEKEQYRADLARVEVEVVDIVDNNYEAFNSSVAGFSAIFQEFTEAQNKVRKLKDYVYKSKETLTNRKRNLKDLWFQKIQHVQVLELLSQMEEINDAPSKMDNMLESEDFVACVDCFQRVHDLAFGSDLASIGALQHLREELVLYKERIQVQLIQALLKYLSSSEHTTKLRRKLLGKSNFDGGEELSHHAVQALNSIVIALNKLSRLPAALHALKSNLREQLGGIVDKHLREAYDFKPPVGLSVSLEKIEEARILAMFTSVLRDFLGIFNRHVQFSTILQTESKSHAGRDYSLKETWSTIQVEVQELLELHLSAQLESNQNARGTENEIHQSEHGGGTNFRFSSIRSKTVDVTRTMQKDAYGSAKRTPICTPSPYRISYLSVLIHQFAEYGDRIAEMSVRPQLLGYVREFCTNVFVPTLRSDCLEVLNRSLERGVAWETYCKPNQAGTRMGHARTVGSQFDDEIGELCACCTNIGTALCEQLYKLGGVMQALSNVDCRLEGVVVDLLKHFSELCERETDRTISGKLCKTWTVRMTRFLKEDPFYIEIVTLSKRQTDFDRVSQALCSFAKDERAEEERLCKQVSWDKARRGYGTTPDLLSLVEMRRLAAIHSTCDLLFRSLALRTNFDKDAFAETHSSNDKVSEAFVNMAPKFLLVMKQMSNLLDSPSVRGILAKLDQTGERCLFALRSEFRVRCHAALKTLPQALASDNPSLERCTGMGQDLIQGMMSIEKSLAPQHGLYVIKSLSALIAKYIILTLQTYGTQPQRGKKKNIDGKDSVSQPCGSTFSANDVVHSRELTWRRETKYQSCQGPAGSIRRGTEILAEFRTSGLAGNRKVAQVCIQGATRRHLHTGVGRPKTTI
uniref:Exocyst complex component Sec8 n=1 Tax=Mucochytrium quahogii TaxID=96639 RepID=A0A7S2WN47_9STRA|mmetsp:Transcript_4350/g.7419  ORF Transcript_4350/g.7419 Transcript_4350/m.7419 type:complete len:909 (-) Transcript_4350:231-2957(-)